MPTEAVVVKHTQPLRIAEAAGPAPGFGSNNLGPVFMDLVPEVIAHLERVGAHPGHMVAYYDEPAEDGSVVVHAGFDIGDQAVDAAGRVTVLELPIIEVASVVHKGSMESVESDYEALIRWIDDIGYRLVGHSRELYLEWDDDNPAACITELQLPIAR